MARIITTECKPLGSAQCDGFEYDADGEPTHNECACECHTTWDDLPSTTAGMRDWHDAMHSEGDVTMQVRIALFRKHGDVALPR